MNVLKEENSIHTILSNRILAETGSLFHTRGLSAPCRQQQHQQQLLMEQQMQAQMQAQAQAQQLAYQQAYQQHMARGPSAPEGGGGSVVTTAHPRIPNPVLPFNHHPT